MAWSLNVQITEVEREIRMRKDVYPRQVGAGKMKQSQADAQLGIMQDVLESLHELREIKNRRTHS